MTKESFFAAAVAVGCGGFAGSVLRYCLSLVEMKSDFPWMTFLTNLLGAVLIGMVAETAARLGAMPPNLVLFLKTGVCGGFTTFSTFSLETVTLLEKNQIKTASAYIVLSLGCCLAGVMIGKTIARGIMKVI